MPVAEFALSGLSRRFRKVLKRNAKVSVACLPSQHATRTHFELYANYINTRHADGDMYPPSLHTFEQFLMRSPADTYFLECKTRSGQLLAVAVTDRLADGLSSVYTFFDTRLDYHNRSLGVLCILKQIELARLLGLGYVYLGYWIKTVKKMRYKIEYLPIELRLTTGEWQRFESVAAVEAVFLRG